MVDLSPGKIKQLWNVTNHAVGPDSKEHARRTCKKTDDREDNRMQNNYDFPKQRKLSLAPLYLFHSSASSSDLNPFFMNQEQRRL